MPIFSNKESRTNPGWMNKCGRNKTGFVLTIFIAAALFIFSCVPYRNIDFQILRPAQIKLGSNFDVVNIHCEYCSDSSQIEFLDSIDRNNARASLNFLYTLNVNLQKSPIFQNTKFSFLTGDSLLIMLKSKTRQNINGLVILLDSIYLKDTIINVGSKYSNYPKLYTFGMIHRFGCHTYTLSNMNLIDNYLLQDTLFWPSQTSGWELYLNTPDLNDVIWDTGINAGEAYAHYLAPYWNDKSRIFFYGSSKSFKGAYRLIQKNELDSALNVLNASAKVSNSNRYFADSSYRIKKVEFYMNYAEQLRLRKLDKTALDWQLE